MCVHVTAFGVNCLPLFVDFYLGGDFNLPIMVFFQLGIPDLLKQD